MTIRQYKLIALFAICHLLFVISGCAPSYPADKLESSIKKICKDEYKTDVNVEIIGSTLCVYMPVEGFFEMNLDFKNVKNLDSIINLMKIRSDVADKIDGAMLSTSRAVLSTDRKLDFYCMIVQDTKQSNIEVVFTRHVTDLKRFMLGDISRSDFISRMLFDIRLNPKVNSEELAKEMFKELGSLPAANIINKYFDAKSEPLKNSLAFIMLASQQDLKKDDVYKITDIRSSRIGFNKVIIWLKAIEEYRPKIGVDSAKFLLPSGFENEYIIMADTQTGQAKIDRVSPLYFPDKEGHIKKIPFADEFKKYEDLNGWADIYFTKPIELADFLATQIAARAPNTIKQNKKLGPLYSVEAQGKFQRSSIKGRKGDFKFYLNPSINITQADAAKEPILNYDTDAIFDALLSMINYVLRRYEFKDFENVELLDIKTGRMKIVNKQILKRYKGEW